MDLNLKLKNEEMMMRMIKNLDYSFLGIEKLLQKQLNANYNSMSMEGKIKHDLQVVFMLNSLYWMYLRLGGFNPTNHKIKSELDRIKTTMDRAKGIMAKPNMLRVDKAAVGRFVEHALWTPEGSKKRVSDELERQNKKTKFDENGDPTM